MKNVVCLGHSSELRETKEFIKGVLKIPEVKISLFVTPHSKEIKKEFQDKIDFILPPVFKNDEFESIYNNNYNLTYEQIESFRATQLKVEHYFHRYQINRGLASYRYFVALGFWLNFFEKNDIKLVFSTEIEHGRLFDSIALDVAKSKKIAIYNINLISGNKNDTLYTLNSYKDVKENFLNIKEIKEYENGGGD